MINTLDHFQFGMHALCQFFSFFNRIRAGDKKHILVGIQERKKFIFDCGIHILGKCD